MKLGDACDTWMLRAGCEEASVSAASSELRGAAAPGAGDDESSASTMTITTADAPSEVFLVRGGITAGGKLLKLGPSMAVEQFREWCCAHATLRGERERTAFFAAAIGEMYDPTLCDVRWNEELLNTDRKFDYYHGSRVLTGADLLSRFLDAAAVASTTPPEEQGGRAAEREGAVVRILMHGTHERNVEPILQRGLVEGKSSRAGRKFWFTTDAGTAVCYACPGRRVVIFAVLQFPKAGGGGGSEAGSLERASKVAEEKHHIITTDDVAHQVPIGSARIRAHVTVRSAWPRANGGSSSSS